MPSGMITLVNVEFIPVKKKFRKFYKTRRKKVSTKSGQDKDDTDNVKLEKSRR